MTHARPAGQSPPHTPDPSSVHGIVVVVVVDVVVVVEGVVDPSHWQPPPWLVGWGVHTKPGGQSPAQVPPLPWHGIVVEVVVVTHWQTVAKSGTVHTEPGGQSPAHVLVLFPWHGMVVVVVLVVVVLVVVVLVVVVGADDVVVVDVVGAVVVVVGLTSLTTSVTAASTRPSYVARSPRAVHVVGAFASAFAAALENLTSALARHVESGSMPFAIDFA